MNAKMYASLEEFMDKWISKWAETEQWTDLNFFCPENIEIMMAKAAANVFDAVVVASKEAEENK